ncbi:hypothetical protein APY03_6731 [Variovorax sp. WDL1]|nr:hypothetical protein APY03_6731 [Variovorax sp. WDL1]
MKPLARMVARFCGTLARLPEHEAPSARSGACARTVGHAAAPDLYSQAVRIRRHLVDLGVGIDLARSGTVTSTQRALQQLQHAYRNLQGLMIGVPERLLDIHPESERRSVRQLLQTALSGSRLQAPTLHATASAAASPCRSGAGALSAMFESGELSHRSLVETFHDMPDRARRHSPKDGEALATLIINARLDHLHKQMLAHRAELSELLKAIGHRRTMPMRLAHGIFLALGQVEGAMIGAESRFETRCQPLIDLIGVRTNELGRYC